MFVVVMWVVLSFVISAGAGNRGRSAFGWLLFSLFLSPLIAGIALLVLGNKPAPAGADEATWTKVCPSCAETVKAAAVKCRFCGAELGPPPPPDPFGGKGDPYLGA